jgi:hypothetical protein
MHALDRRCESNPALITRASIQWLEAWSNGGMKAIADSKFKDVMANSQDVTAAMAAQGSGMDIVGSMVCVSIAPARSAHAEARAQDL